MGVLLLRDLVQLPLILLLNLKVLALCCRIRRRLESSFLGWERMWMQKLRSVCYILCLARQWQNYIFSFQIYSSM